jgi:CHAT domain-containing protein
LKNTGSKLQLETEIFRELSELSSDEKRRKFFEEHPELATHVQVEKLSAEVADMIRINLEAAHRLAMTTRWLAKQLGDELDLALSARVLANSLHFLLRCEEAQEYYDEALERYQFLADEKEMAISRSSALVNLAYLGRYDQVFAWHEEARRVFEEQDDRLRLANLAHNLANIYHRQDRWQEALRQYRIAHGEFVLLGRAQNAAICLRNIAVCLIILHNFSEAIQVYEESRAYCMEHGLDRLLLEVDYNIAYLYYQRGEYTRSIQAFQAARKRCDEAGDDYHKALCDLDQAEIFLELNLAEEAAGLAESAIAGFAALRMPYEHAKALTNHAIALGRQGKSASALELLTAARQIFDAEGNHMWLAQIDFYHAVVLYREKRPVEAIRLARRARQSFAESNLASRAALCELLLSELHLQSGEPQEAHRSCYEALERLTTLDLPALEHQAYLVLGQVEEARGERHAALDAYNRSQRWLERLRSQLKVEELKLAFLKDKHVVYESLVWLTMRDKNASNRLETTFNYIEKAKSRSLADLMAYRPHALAPKSAEHGQLADEVRDLREELNWFYHQIDKQQMRGDKRATEEVGELRRNILSKEDELLRYLRQIQATDHEFGSLQAGNVVDLETFRSTLPQGGILIEYFIARDTIFVCVVDHQRLEIVPLTTATHARKLHRLLQFQLSKSMRRPTDQDGAQDLVAAALGAHLEELYDALLAPIRHYLVGDHLIFAPHGFLHYIPFHALSDGSAYLIDQFSISYAPSASVFHLCATKKTSCSSCSLVLGVADQRTPHILEEARAVATSLPNSRLLLGEEATEEALREHGDGCRYVHIATHGLFRRDNPMFSAIQLGKSRLSLFDLYDLRLSAEMVVLSGCGTGLNAVLGAEELVGLTRGLLYAGAQSVLVTLWDVNDASAADFMSRFYRHLAQGRRRAEALRQTMIEIRQDYPLPYHWAPFVLVGQPQL